MNSLPEDPRTPYLSVVVTTCRDAADDGEGDPIEHLQRFVSCFDEQCRQSGLDAEVIVVEWNLPADRVPAAARLRLPNPSRCTYRFIDVPAAVHDRLRHAHVLCGFPMIARNVGVRRARGRFVLATSIDVIFPNSLIAHLASGALQRKRLYRADRHEVDPAVPAGAPLATVLNHCATHQRRIHARSGSYASNADGSVADLDDDIVDGRELRLGDGWHLREGDGRSGFFRWAASPAAIILEPTERTGSLVLEIDIEANPHDPRAWIRLEVVDGERLLSSSHISVRTRVQVPLEQVNLNAPSQIELRVAAMHAKPRYRLPVFERREELLYRVHSVAIVAAAEDRSMVKYPLSGWQNADPKSAQTVAPSADGLLVETLPTKWLYSMQHPIQAPASGSYRFELSCSVLEGRVLVGVLNSNTSAWLPASVTVRREGNRHRFGISVDLGRRESCWLTISNDHPDGAGVSRFVINGLTGSVGPTKRARSGSGDEESPAPWRTRVAGAADAIARAIVAWLPDPVRRRIAGVTAERLSLERAFYVADERARRLAPLEDFAEVATTLRRNRPRHLHVNHCGDFQLMAREHWHELRGYPELEGFSDRIDAVLSFIADTAGISEELLDTPIYHAPSPVRAVEPADEDAVMRGRLARRAVPKLDEGTVSIWASQMRWLQTPMMFNTADWGVGSIELQEHTISPASNSVS